MGASVVGFLKSGKNKSVTMNVLVLIFISAAGRYGRVLSSVALLPPFVQLCSYQPVYGISCLFWGSSSRPFSQLDLIALS